MPDKRQPDYEVIFKDLAENGECCIEDGIKVVDLAYRDLTEEEENIPCVAETFAIKNAVELPPQITNTRLPDYTENGQVITTWGNDEITVEEKEPAEYYIFLPKYSLIFTPPYSPPPGWRWSITDDEDLIRQLEHRFSKTSPVK